MNRIVRFTISFAILLTLAQLNCSGPVQKQKYTIPYSAGLEHYFNIAEYSSSNPHSTLLILDPLFFNISALEPVANYFARHGHQVLILELKDPVPPVILPDESQLLGAIEMIRRQSPDRPIFAMGVSLGGIAWLPLLKERHPSLSGVMFLGTGFDYEYPGSFQKQIQGYKEEGAVLAELCINPGNCPGFMRPDLFDGGIRLKALPLRPRGLTGKRILNHFQSIQTPVAFVAGKIDGISPSESIFPALKSIGLDKVGLNPNGPIFYLEASKANGMNSDYDHFDLFNSLDAEDEIYDLLEEWMNGRRTKE